MLGKSTLLSAFGLRWWFYVYIAITTIVNCIVADPKRGIVHFYEISILEGDPMFGKSALQPDLFLRSCTCIEGSPGNGKSTLPTKLYY